MPVFSEDRVSDVKQVMTPVIRDDKQAMTAVISDDKQAIVMPSKR